MNWTMFMDDYSVFIYWTTNLSGENDLSVHELQPEAVEARLRAGKKTPNLGRSFYLQLKGEK